MKCLHHFQQIRYYHPVSYSVTPFPTHTEVDNLVHMSKNTNPKVFHARIVDQLTISVPRHSDTSHFGTNCPKLVVLSNKPENQKRPKAGVYTPKI